MIEQKYEFALRLYDNSDILSNLIYLSKGTFKIFFKYNNLFQWLQNKKYAHTADRQK